MGTNRLWFAHDAGEDSWVYRIDHDYAMSWGHARGGYGFAESDRLVDILKTWDVVSHEQAIRVRPAIADLFPLLPVGLPKWFVSRDDERILRIDDQFGYQARIISSVSVKEICDANELDINHFGRQNAEWGPLLEEDVSGVIVGWQDSPLAQAIAKAAGAAV